MAEKSSVKVQVDAALPSEATFESAGVRASLLEYLHACPVCRDTRTVHYCRVPSLYVEGEHIVYERCPACGVVFRNPRLTTKVREAKYEDKLMPESAKAIIPENQVHYVYMMRLLRKLLPPGCGKRLLDFGCGGGQFMVEACKAGFDVMGLELNKDLVGFVTETYGYPVYQGLVTDPEFKDERFDVIISSQVFEHLVDPRGSLEELLRHLNKPGLMLIELPNLRHVRERLKKGAVMDDSHLFYFSSKSLPRMMEKAGMRVVKVQEGLRPYRVLKSNPWVVPDAVHDLGMKLAALAQVRTGLSAVAVWE